MVEDLLVFYVLAGAVVTVATWAHDIGHHPCPSFARAFALGVGWGVYVLALLGTPLASLKERPMRRWGQRHAARVALATDMWAEALRRGADDSPARREALRALDDATRLAAAALRHPDP